VTHCVKASLPAGLQRREPYR